MTVALVANIARPISSAISTAFSADSYGLLSSYGMLGASASPDAVIEALFANNEVGAWYDPSDLTTMFQDSAGTTPVTADGQPVGKMLDKSGNNNHIQQATDINRPVYTNRGSVSVLTFDGIKTYLSNTLNLSTITKCTIIATYKTKRVSGVGGILWHGNDLAYSIGFFENLGSSGSAFVNAGGSSGQYQQSYSIFNNTYPENKILCAVIDPSKATKAERVSIYIDGYSADPYLYSSSAGDISSSIFSSRTLSIGQYNGYFTNCDLTGVLIVGRALTNEEIKNVANWFYIKQTSNDFAVSSFDNSMRVIDRVDYLQTSAYANLTYQTDATSITVSGYASGSFATTYTTLSKIGIFVDGSYNQDISVSSNGSFSLSATLPAGQKTVTVYNSPQHSAGNVRKDGLFITNVSFNSTYTKVTQASSNRLIVYGDSIVSGYNSTPVHQNSWVSKVRTSWPGSTIVEADGARSLYLDCATSDLVSRFVGKISSLSPSVLYLAIGTNDYGLNQWNASAFGVAYSALLDALHSAIPSLHIYCQTPILRSSEVANSVGSTTGDYRTAIANAVSTRTEFSTLVDGTAILTTSDLSDGLHPTTSGHAIYANYVKTILGVS